MAGHSRQTRVVSIRLPNDVVDKLERRAKSNNVPLTDYLRDRIIYDTTRKHGGDNGVMYQYVPYDRGNSDE